MVQLTSAWKCVEMNNSERHVFSDPETLSAAAANYFSETATDAVRARGRFLVALSGGGTPQMLYQLLSEEPFLSAVPWQQIHFFWGDERLVPPQNEGSNYRQVFQTLLSKAMVPSANIHRIQGELSPAEATLQYQTELSRFAASGLKWPKFDLILLGLGSDGHTASLFPGPIPAAHARLPVAAVTADYGGRPAQRITLTPLVFNQARRILFLVAGESKRQALQMVTQGPEELEQWPAQRIRPAAGMVSWYVDAAAAGG